MPTKLLDDEQMDEYDEHHPTGGLAVPVHSVMPALRRALEPTVDDALIAGHPAPAPGARAVPVSVLLAWWFECVWPELQRRRAGGGGGPEEEEAAGEEEGEEAAVEVV